MEDYNGFQLYYMVIFVFICSSYWLVWVITLMELKSYHFIFFVLQTDNTGSVLYCDIVALFN